MKTCPNCDSNSMRFSSFLTMGIFSERTCINCGELVHYARKERIMFTISTFMNAFIAMFLIFNYLVEIDSIKPFAALFAVMYYLVAIVTTYYVLPLTKKE